jgi:crotonobetainyl-CoA:carnitine CoA-transferase CaiB-like acyl-CoA transferase
LDLTKPNAKAALQRLLAACDSVFANLRPGAAERMGIRHDDHAHLVASHVSAFGWTGPYARRPGLDPLAQAMIGLQHAQGGQGNLPSCLNLLAPVDYTTGLIGALDTVVALYQREHTGTAQMVETNLLNGAIVLSSAWFSRYENRPSPQAADQQQYGLNAYHRLFVLQDGWIYIAADQPREQAALKSLLGVDNLDPVGQGHPAVSPLGLALAEQLSGQTISSALSALKSAGVPAARVLSGNSEAFLDDPHPAANDLITFRRHPKVGVIKSHTTPFSFLAQMRAQMHPRRSSVSTPQISWQRSVLTSAKSKTYSKVAPP